MADMLDFITKSIDNKLKVLALHLDVSKAFDSLNQSILLSKLEHYGVRGTVLSWFSSYFSLHFQFTEQLIIKSQFRKINSGIPQGSVVGPFPYLVYVNDIFNFSSEVKSILYADNTTLLIADSNLHNQLHRATNIFGLHSVWFQDNLLALNANKSQCMFYFCKSYDLLNTLSFDDHVASRVDSVKFLGFYFDSMLYWDKHIEHIRVKMSRCIGMIKLCKFLPKTSLILMYNAFMLPFILRGY